MDRNIQLKRNLASIRLNCERRDDIDENVTYWVFKPKGGPVMLEERHMLILKKRLMDQANKTIISVIEELEGNMEDSEYED